MSQVGASSEVNVWFFIYHTRFSVCPIVFHNPLYSPWPHWNQQFAFFFWLGTGTVFTKKHSLSLLIRCTKYVMAKRVQPSCVDMQTLDCWLDRIQPTRPFSDASVSEMTDDSVLERSAHLQIVKQWLLCSCVSSTIAGIKNACVRGQWKSLLAEWGWFAFCLYAFNRDNRNRFTFFSVLLQDRQQWYSGWQLTFVSVLGTNEDRLGRLHVEQCECAECWRTSWCFSTG